jgi:hypothetical protein
VVRQLLPPLAAKDDTVNGSTIPLSETASKRAAVSSFLIALLLFVILAVPSHYSRASLLDKNDAASCEVISGVEQFQHLKIRPTVVFVGNSVIRYPIWLTDFARFTGIPNSVVYHEAQWFDRNLESVGLQFTPSFSLAVDGAIASDVFLLCNKILTNDRSPKLLIYGLIPLAYSGALVNAETSTPTYRLLFQLHDCAKWGSLYASSSSEAQDMWLGQLFALYRERRLFCQSFADVGDQLSAAIIGHKISSSNKNLADPVKSSAADRLGHLERQSDSNLINQRLKRDPASQTGGYKNQIKCLRALLSLATDRGMHVLLIEMPIPVETKRKVFRQVLADYHSSIYAAAGLKHFSVLDLEDNHQIFDQSCFMDDIHLNESGSEKLDKLLAAWIRQHETQIFDQRN